MAISSHQEANRVHVVTLSGQLNWAEFQTFLNQAEAQKVFAAGKVKVLIRLEDFAGWEPGDQWGDVSFFFQHDADIERIAIVGDLRWRDEMLVFLFADYRSAEAQFFPAADLEQARAWLIS